ncbi:unnamed protein product [Paramecium octaurelia]|uniref:Uncharacterized protein n=1 Tax=Paramecium octaurelia TaxID=43137 RepID=A0A8S1WYY2_PAROT|nr:unnamed protein product [Paramecium octaurelia]
MMKKAKKLNWGVGQKFQKSLHIFLKQLGKANTKKAKRLAVGIFGIRMQMIIKFQRLVVDHTMKEVQGLNRVIGQKCQKGFHIILKQLRVVNIKMVKIVVFG